MPYTPEQEFGEMTLSDYDSNEDADYEPSESEDSDDELEFNSDASVSEDSEVEGEEEVLVKEELVEEDAKIQEFSIYLTLELSCLTDVFCKKSEICSSMILLYNVPARHLS